MNTAVEDILVLAMAEEAIASENNTFGQHLEYWIGGVKTDDAWEWRSGAPMDYTNWNEDNGGNGHFAQLLRNNYTSYSWWAIGEADGDSGVICEMSLTGV